MSYTPKTKLVKGVAWPKYVKTKSTKGHIWDEKPTVTTSGRPFSKISELVIEYLQSHPWSTSYTIGKAIGLPTKVVSVKCHQFKQSGRFVDRTVDGQRGKTTGFAINENY